MPRQNTRQSYNSGRSTRSSSYGSSGGGRSSSYGGRGTQQEQREPVNYVPLFTLFFTDKGGRCQVDIKPLQNRDGESVTEQTISLEEWLKIAEMLYYGEIKLTGSLWESKIQQADLTGNIRLTEEQFEEILGRLPGEAPRKKAAPAKKAPAARTTRQPAKRNYREELANDEEEVEVDDIPFDDAEDEDDEVV